MRDFFSTDPDQALRVEPRAAGEAGDLSTLERPDQQEASTR